MSSTGRLLSISRSTIIGYVVLCLIWGSTWLAIRILVRDVPPLESLVTRFSIAGVLLVGFSVLQRRRWPRGERKWNAMVVLGFTIMAIPYGLLFWAEQYVTSSMTAVLYSAVPLVVALLTPAMMHRKVPRSAVLSMVIAFGALVVLFYTGLSTSRTALLGGAAIVLSMVFSSWSIVYAKDRLHEIDSVIATGMQILIACVPLLWGSWVFEARRHAHWTRSSLLAMAFLILFGSCLAFVIYYWLLKRMQPYQLATTSLIVPIVAVTEGALFAREPVPPMMLVAMAVVLGCVGSVLRAEAGVERRHDILMLRSKS